MIRAEKNLHQFAMGWRASTVIEERQLDAAFNAGVVQSNLTMAMPSFDYTGVDGGKVNLSKLAKMRIRALEHMEHGPTLIGNSP